MKTVYVIITQQPGSNLVTDVEVMDQQPLEDAIDPRTQTVYMANINGGDAMEIM